MDTARERLQEKAKDGASSSNTPVGSGRNSPAAQSLKTEAERRFEEVQRERVRLIRNYWLVEL